MGIVRRKPISRSFPDSDFLGHCLLNRSWLNPSISTETTHLQPSHPFLPSFPWKTTADWSGSADSGAVKVVQWLDKVQVQLSHPRAHDMGLSPEKYTRNLCNLFLIILSRTRKAETAAKAHHAQWKAVLYYYVIVPPSILLHGLSKYRSHIETKFAYRLIPVFVQTSAVHVGESLKSMVCHNIFNCVTRNIKYKFKKENV